MSPCPHCFVCCCPQECHHVHILLCVCSSYHQVSLCTDCLPCFCHQLPPCRGCLSCFCHPVLIAYNSSVTAVTKCHRGAAPDHPGDPAVRLPDRPGLPHPDDQPGKLLRDLLLHARGEDAPPDGHAAPGVCPVGGALVHQHHNSRFYLSQSQSNLSLSR